MIITANFSTYSKRKDVVDRSVESIVNQVDIVRVHYNDYEPDKREWEQYTGEDYTDRSKFIHIGESEIAFTCDDDLIYPPDYVQITLAALREYGGIVTYHGRKLKGSGLDYYHGHNVYHFRYQDGQQDTRIDVPGTGVMAFNSNDFYSNVLKYKQDKMVDLIIGLEAAKQEVPITCIRHKSNWIRSLRTPETIYDDFIGGSSEQNKLADEIFRARNKKFQLS